MRSSPYDILGVAKDASAKGVKTAYRKRALRLHPDKNRGHVAEGWTELVDAYTVLSAPDLRAVWNRWGWSGFGIEIGDKKSPSENARMYELAAAEEPGVWKRHGEKEWRALALSTVGAPADVVVGVSVPWNAVRSGHGPLNLFVDTEVICEGCYGTGGEWRAGCRSCNGSGVTRVELPVAPGIASLSRLDPCSSCHGNGLEPRSSGTTCEMCEGRGKVGLKKEVSVSFPPGLVIGLKRRAVGIGAVEVGRPQGDVVFEVVSLEGSPPVGWFRGGAGGEGILASLRACDVVMAMTLPAPAAVLGAVVDMDVSGDGKTVVQVGFRAPLGPGSARVVAGAGLPIVSLDDEIGEETVAPANGDLWVVVTGFSGTLNDELLAQAKEQSGQVAEGVRWPKQGDDLGPDTRPPWLSWAKL